MAVSIKDIAKKVGVSDAAVSMALRNHPRISESRQKQIRKAARQMNYHPNLLARGLVQKKTNSIGLIMAEVELEVVSAKMITLNHLAEEAGYRMYLVHTEGRQDRALRSASELISRGVDGLIVYGTSFGKSDVDAASKLGSQVPVVFLDQYISDSGLHVRQDKAAGVEQAVNHLHNLGHENIFMMFGYWANWQEAPRFTGFVKGMEQIGIADANSRIVEICSRRKIDENGHYAHDAEETHQRVQMFLKNHPECTALICSSDEIALTVMRSLHRLGRKIPEDISLVGFDNIPSGRLSWPALTTIAQPIQKLAEATLNMLLHSIKNKESASEKIVIPTELIIRESTGRRIQKSEVRNQI